MAADSSLKSFWKRGSHTKLPGRPQQVHKAGADSEEEEMQHPLGHPPPGMGPRVRSKTFEEYEKETDDAWDDKEEDFSDLSVPSDLEASREGGKKSVATGDSHLGAEGGRQRKNSKGKGKNDLMAFFTDRVRPRASGSPMLRKSESSQAGRTRSQSDQSASSSASSPHSPRTQFLADDFDPHDRETMKLQKFGKLLAGPNTDLDQLRKLSWSGIPSPVRATTWQLLCGYLPANIDRREETLQRKRKEYLNCLDQYYHMRSDSLHMDTFRQIHIDVPRMNPDIPLFQQKLVQECFERILFLWAMRHPASGYVQGINDLVTPFFVVFLSYYISGDKNPETFNMETLPVETIKMIEADSFWCLMKLLEGVQDNYTLAQPGIQVKIKELQELMKRIDSSLDEHLVRNSVEYIQFAFRWMNNLLMREFPLRCVIRLWDSYLSERDGFATFHVYVCAALLRHFSDYLRSKIDFQEIMVLIQKLPTESWTDDDMELLLAEAFKLKFIFADAPGHLQPVRT